MDPITNYQSPITNPGPGYPRIREKEKRSVASRHIIRGEIKHEYNENGTDRRDIWTMVIILCKESGFDYALIDERTPKEKAALMGVNTMGVLGVMDLAIEMGFAIC